MTPSAFKASVISHVDWFALFSIALVLLPLPFGGNRPWISDLFAILCSLLLLGMAWRLYVSPPTLFKGAPWRRLKISSLLIALVAVWGFLQTQSWMPTAWHHPLWNSVQSLPRAYAGSISIDPDQSTESLARLLSYVACFFLALIGGRDSQRALYLLRFLAGAAVAYALYGLLAQSTGLQKILWFDKWAYENSLTSTFVNKNSYATYAGLGLQACLALMWTQMKHKLGKIPEENAKKADWLENLLRKDSYALVMCMIVLGALLLTGSRAGLLSSLAGCLVFLLALAVNRTWKWKRWLPVLLTGIVLIVGLSWFNDLESITQFNEQLVTSDTSKRLAAYQVAQRTIASNPWLGFGLGSFSSAFQIYRDPTVRESFQHAHSDYLELAVELGIPATLMLLTSILVMIGCCVEGVRKRKRHEIYPILALSASATVGIHALVDFSMQIPAVAATYAAILGLGVAQSWSSRSVKGVTAPSKDYHRSARR